MADTTPEKIIVTRLLIPSAFLERRVTVDFYLPVTGGPMPVLLVNDGQDLPRMPFGPLLDQLLRSNEVRPLCCIAVHAGPDRKREYGTAHATDYLGRGNGAAAYTRFILEELIPIAEKELPFRPQHGWAFAGFSLGGLSALDIAWHHPERFHTTGVFSGSLWWRSLDMADPGYQDEQHRLMHRAIRTGPYVDGRRFFFECGTEDETADRNRNGVIDSIDDTLDLIAELESKGYQSGADIKYLEIKGGKHDVATWAKAMPSFLQWAWGNK